jgi:hypothetical protein
MKRSDSILQQFYMSMLPKAQMGLVKSNNRARGDMQSYYPQIARMNDSPQRRVLAEATAKRQEQERARRIIESQPSVSQYTPVKDLDEARRYKFAKQYAATHGGYSDEQGNYTQGLLGDMADSKLAARTWDNIVVPGFEAEMLVSGAGLVGKGLKTAGKYALENTALKNSLKYNSLANKGVDDLGIYTQRGGNKYYNLGEGFGDLGAEGDIKKRFLDKLTDDELKDYLSGLSYKQQREFYGLPRYDIDPRIRNEAKELIANSKDLYPIDGWFLNSDWKSFGNEMRGVMKNHGLDYKNQLDVEKFRKMFVDNELDNIYFDAQRNQIKFPDLAIHSSFKSFLSKNKNGGVIKDNRGQWAHPGKVTRISSPNITMQGVPYPVLGVGSNGEKQMMYPGQDYNFSGASYVDEYPIMKNGGEMIKRKDGSYSKRGLWDNIRANKGSGKKPTKEMLKQEHKIKSKEMKYGGTNNPGFEALPEYVQAKILSNMGYGGYYNPMMEEGGEPNGGMALGQMMAVSDKMNKLRQFISPDKNLDPWIASKLAVMDDSADAITNYMMYNPEAQGDGEEMEEEDMEEMMANGGYVVTRSNDRKGKTHKVTGPDGTVKYFGDSKLGQHPKDPKRKAAFYARHKKNLDNNPFFRAFARKTWQEGGLVEMQKGGNKALVDNTYVASKPISAFYPGSDYPSSEEQLWNIIKSSPKLMWDKLNVDMPAYVYSKIARAGEKIGLTPNSELFPTYGSQSLTGAQLELQRLDEYQKDRWKKIRKGEYKKGGSTFSGNAFYQNGGQPQLEDYPDYNSWRQALLAYQQSGVDNMDLYTSDPSLSELYPAPQSFQGRPLDVRLPVQEKPSKKSNNYKGVSIVDYLNSMGLASDFNTRKQIASEKGITNYRGTAEQNMQLLSMLSGQPYSKESTSSSNKGTPKSLPKKGTSSYIDSRLKGAQETPSLTGWMAAQQFTNPFYLGESDSSDIGQNMDDENLRASETRRKVIAGDVNAEFTFPNGKTKKWKDMTMKEQFYITGKNLGSLKNNNWTDYVNPLAILGSLSEGVGTMAYDADEQDSFVPYVKGIGAPLLAGFASNVGKLLPKTTYLPYNPNQLPASSTIPKLLRAPQTRGLLEGPQLKGLLPSPSPRGFIIPSTGVRSAGYPMFEDGGIHLDPAKKGTFKAQATRMGMGVQEAASTILNAPEGKYSPAMRKKANFARNFAKQDGGLVDGTEMEVTPEQADWLKSQGYEFEII